jgi:hypothetical protein
MCLEPSFLLKIAFECHRCDRSEPMLLSPINSEGVLFISRSSAVPVTWRCADWKVCTSSHPYQKRLRESWLRSYYSYMKSGYMVLLLESASRGWSHGRCRGMLPSTLHLHTNASFCTVNQVTARWTCSLRRWKLGPLSSLPCPGANQRACHIEWFLINPKRL